MTATPDQQIEALSTLSATLAEELDRARVRITELERMERAADNMRVILERHGAVLAHEDVARILRDLLGK